MQQCQKCSRSGSNKKQKELKIIFKQAEGISEEEIQRRISAAFDILFTETLKKRNNVARNT
ncbi:MAG: hypothetical protein WC459_04875 [Patescibacteria group bacterium]